MQDMILLKKNIDILLTLVSAVLTGLAFNVQGLSLLGWISLIPLIYVIFTDKNKKGGYKKLFVFGVVYYITHFMFLFKLYPLEFAGFEPALAGLLLTLAVVLFSIIEAFYLGFVGLIYKKINPKKYFKPLIFAGLWIMAEYLQGFGIFGYTSGRLSLSQYLNVPLIKSASFLGSLFVSFVIVTVSGYLVLGIISIVKSKNKKQNLLKSKDFIFPVSIAFFIFVSNILIGFASTKDLNPQTKVVAIQGNIGSTEKWADGATQLALDKYLELSYNAIQENPQIILWPETAVPVYLRGNSKILEAYQKLAIDSSAILLVGAHDRTGEGEDKKYYNGVFAIDNQGIIGNPYYKRQLVPFGEYIPFRDTLIKIAPFIEEINMLGNDLTPGNDSKIMETKLGKIGALICFDSIFPQLARNSVQDGAQLIVLSTNDSWFLDSTGTTKHLASSVFRAIENNRYLVRAGNTGISAIINPNGQIIEELGALEEGYISGDVEFISKNNIYTKIGDIVVYIALVFVAGYYIYQRKNNKI